MTITISCPDCGMEYKLKDDALGKKFPCRECDSPIVVKQKKSRKVEDFDPEYEDEESSQRLARPGKQNNQYESTRLTTSPGKRPAKKPKAPSEGFIQRVGVWNFVTIIITAIFLFVAALGLFIPALGKGIAYVGITISIVLFMVSAVWIYVIAFLEDTTQYSEFLRCLLIPFYILFFVYQSISETWKPLLIAIVAGFFLLITLAYKNKSEKGGVFNSPESPRTSETRFVSR